MGGKQRLGAITKMGERSLRRLLIIEANSVIIKRHVHQAARPGTRLAGVLSRKPPMLSVSRWPTRWRVLFER